MRSETDKYSFTAITVSSSISTAIVGSLEHGTTTGFLGREAWVSPTRPARQALIHSVTLEYLVTHNTYQTDIKPVLNHA